MCLVLMKKQGAKLVYIPKTEYYELPTKYNKTIVRLLVQSPTRMFVYWQVSDEYIKNFSSKHGNYSEWVPVLKIDNLTMNYSYDLPIDPFTNNYYIEVKDPDCEYQVELGRKRNNEFVNIYTSNHAMIPRSAPLPFDYSNDIIYRNYIRLDVSDRFKIYRKGKSYEDYVAGLKDYNELAFANPEDSRRNSGSFTRYENGVSSMENISSLDNVSSFNNYYSRS